MRLVDPADGSYETAKFQKVGNPPLDDAAQRIERGDRRTMLISIVYGRPRSMRCAASSRVGCPLSGTSLSVRAHRRIDEPHGPGHVGLDAESSDVLNELWSAGSRR